MIPRRLAANELSKEDEGISEEVRAKAYRFIHRKERTWDSSSLTDEYKPDYPGDIPF